jgi:hypothetical protein
MRRIRGACVVASATAVSWWLAASAFAALPAGWTEGTAQLVHKGSTVLASAGDPAASNAVDSLQAADSAAYRGDPFFHGVDNGTQAHLPTPGSTSTSTAPAGFDGMSYLDQRLADGAHQRLATPPDQALCVGNGFVLEGVNLALRVYSTSGAPLTPPVALSPFFGDGHEMLSTDGTNPGPVQHSDPRCLFDQDTGRFMVTALHYARDPVTGNPAAPVGIELAVSRTGDPRSQWDVYALDTTADGAHGSDAVNGCPCLGDQPELGADANGIYITSSLFQLSNLQDLTLKGQAAERFYAISKRSLAAGTADRAVTLTLPRAARPPGGFPTHTDPAVAPPGGAQDGADGGTEHLTSLCGVGFSVVYVFALTNTSSLDTASPDLSLSEHVLATEPTGSLGVFGQPDGLRPLASWIQQQTGGAEPPVEYLDSGNPCTQLVYADGRLWTARMTEVKPDNGAVRDGIAWMQIVPNASGGQIANQGYLSINRGNAILGAITVDRTGHGVIAFDAYGDDLYPSAAYAPIDEQGTGAARIVAQGQVPLDNFDGYRYFGASGRFARYGDYSGAVTAGDGDFWIANEYTPNIPRTQLLSWGTHITEVP